VLAGIVALFLHDRGRDQVDPLPLAVLIYAELTAAISILLALNWLFSWTHHLQHFSIDFCMSAMWFIAFALLVTWVLPLAPPNHSTGAESPKVVCVTNSKRAQHSVFWWLSSG
jgi:hypothetical protein